MASKNEEETLRIAARLGRGARPGIVILLSGPLGAGKTTFVRGFLRGLGHRGAVPSPTFSLVNEYRRVVPRVYHMDLYRIEGGEVPGLALEEYLGDDGAVSLIEWPEAARDACPRDRLEVSLVHAKPGRSLTFRALGPRARLLLAALDRRSA